MDLIPREKAKRSRAEIQAAPEDIALASSCQCPGCDGKWLPPVLGVPTANEWLYCSSLCAEKAKYVRWMRNRLVDGTADQPDIKEAAEIKLSWLFSGGYASRSRSLSPSIRAAVFARDRGLCQACGSPGTEIDHVAGDSGEISNLQLLCHACHLAKTLDASEFREATEREREELLALHIRVRNPVPLYPADDERTWRTRWATIRGLRMTEFRRGG